MSGTNSGDRTLIREAPRLSSWQADNLAAICAIGRDRLERIADLLDGGDLLISRPKIERLFAEQTDERLAPELARFLFGLALGSREDSSAPEIALARINEMVEQSPEGSAQFAGWEGCRPILARLLASRSIRLASKALEVSYDFERVYQAGRFLTTLRPIFDDARKEILGATIVHTLRLEFFSSSGEQASLSIALDRADIAQLRRACDEALQKADATFTKSSQGWGLPTIMPGEDV